LASSWGTAQACRWWWGVAKEVAEETAHGGGWVGWWEGDRATFQFTQGMVVPDRPHPIPEGLPRSG